METAKKAAGSNQRSAVEKKLKNKRTTKRHESPAWRGFQQFWYEYDISMQQKNNPASDQEVFEVAEQFAQGLTVFSMGELLK